MKEGLLKRGERVTMTSAAIAAGLGSLNGLRDGIVTSDEQDDKVGVKIIGGRHAGGSERYAKIFWMRDERTPEPPIDPKVLVHLLSCLGEEGSEIAQDVSKCIRFGIDDRNFLNPTGPTNRAKLIGELNDLLGAAAVLVDHGVLPEDWMRASLIAAKKGKILSCLAYAAKVGAV